MHEFLAAAVFTSRLDWYRKTGCCPATVSSSPLGLSSHPYAARSRTTLRLERFIPLQAPWLCWNDDRKCHYFIVYVPWLIVWNTCSMCAHNSEMLPLVNCADRDRSDSIGFYSPFLFCSNFLIRQLNKFASNVRSLVLGVIFKTHRRLRISYVV